MDERNHTDDELEYMAIELACRGYGDGDKWLTNDDVEFLHNRVEYWTGKEFKGEAIDEQ